ncbi:hypothetical protein [Pseudoneobacillus sp. C159]
MELRFLRDQYRVEYFWFFEGGFDPPAKDERVYLKEFLQEKVSSIFWEVNLSYSPLKEPREVRLKAVYYHPDGSVFGIDELDEVIEPASDSYWFSSGFGYEETGYWYPGEYRVEFYINDQFMIEETFHIKADEEFLNRVSAEPLRFFSGEYDHEPDPEERSYLTEFSHHQTSYIYWEVELAYPKLEKSRWVKFQYMFYGPDGNAIDSNYYPIKLEEGSDFSIHSMGLGFDSPGDWQLGKHRIEIYLNGSLVGDGKFEILKDNLFIFPSMQAVAFGFFEGGLKSPPPEERVYETVFQKETARFINWEIELSFPTLQKRKQINLVQEYFLEDGSVLVDGEDILTLEKGWNSASINMGKGDEEPGLWEPGRYRVKITIDGKQMVEDWFEVV